MPTVNVSRNLLFEKIGETFTDASFDHLCFQFGIELDEITESDTPNDLTYKIDIPANRYDLLCVEGIARALRVFLGKETAPLYTSVTPKEVIRTHVDPSVADIRPFVVTGVLRGVKMNQATYTTLIDLQEKLHHNICRKRQFVAIGVHDLSKVTPPFTYACEEPTLIKFKPLNKQQEYNAVELMELYKSDAHLKPYLSIIQDKPLYPVIRDSNGEVLSMPPIINSDKTKIGVGGVLDLFFECTATDEQRATTVLDTLMTMVSEHAGVKYESELTEVVYPDSVKIFPQLTYREFSVDPEKAVKAVGVQMTPTEIAKNLEKMSLKTEIGAKIRVTVPPTRSDIIHNCDIIEDIAISYGYDEILKQSTLPKSMTIARQHPLNKLSDALRENLAQAGFTEALTFSLCSIEDECEKVRIPRENIRNLALIQNPKTIEFQTARLTLLPGLLKTVQANKKMPLPLKLFEVSDVVTICDQADTGTLNRRNLSALIYNKTPNFDHMHGLLDRMMELLEVQYKLESSENPTYFSGMCAGVIVNGNKIGHIGVLHPEVCANFELTCPASAMEICVESFL